MHFSAFQDFQNEILFQYSRFMIHRNLKQNKTKINSCNGVLEDIHNMSQDPGFMQEKVQKGDFLK